MGVEESEIPQGPEVREGNQFDEAFAGVQKLIGERGERNYPLGEPINSGFDTERLNRAPSNPNTTEAAGGEPPLTDEQWREQEIREATERYIQDRDEVRVLLANNHNLTTEEVGQRLSNLAEVLAVESLYARITPFGVAVESERLISPSTTNVEMRTLAAEFGEKLRESYYTVLSLQMGSGRGPDVIMPDGTAKVFAEDTEWVRTVYQAMKEDLQSDYGKFFPENDNRTPEQKAQDQLTKELEDYQQFYKEKIEGAIPIKNHGVLSAWIVETTKGAVPEDEMDISRWNQLRTEMTESWLTEYMPRLLLTAGISYGQKFLEDYEGVLADEDIKTILENATRIDEERKSGTNAIVGRIETSAQNAPATEVLSEETQRDNYIESNKLTLRNRLESIQKYMQETGSITFEINAYNEFIQNQGESLVFPSENFLRTVLADRFIGARDLPIDIEYLREHLGETEAVMVINKVVDGLLRLDRDQRPLTIPMQDGTYREFPEDAEYQQLWMDTIRQNVIPGVDLSSHIPFAEKIPYMGVSGAISSANVTERAPQNAPVTEKLPAEPVKEKLKLTMEEVDKADFLDENVNPTGQAAKDELDQILQKMQETVAPEGKTKVDLGVPLAFPHFDFTDQQTAELAKVLFMRNMGALILNSGTSPKDPDSPYHTWMNNLTYDEQVSFKKEMSYVFNKWKEKQPKQS